MTGAREPEELATALAGMALTCDGGCCGSGCKEHPLGYRPSSRRSSRACRRETSTRLRR